MRPQKNTSYTSHQHKFSQVLVLWAPMGSRGHCVNVKRRNSNTSYVRINLSFFHNILLWVSFSSPPYSDRRHCWISYLRTHLKNARCCGPLVVVVDPWTQMKIHMLIDFDSILDFYLRCCFFDPKPIFNTQRSLWTPRCCFCGPRDTNENSDVNTRCLNTRATKEDMQRPTQAAAPLRPAQRRRGLYTPRTHQKAEATRLN